jgi:hypothetical protein
VATDRIGNLCGRLDVVVFIIWILVARGVSLGRIQKWRETNKRFLQFSAGAGAIILGAFVYIVEVVSSVARLF